MQNGPHIAQIAALVGDPGRANILTALFDGRALTATELAHAAGVTPQTASAHLAKLADMGLLAPEKQGRHRYFRLATPMVARMLESIMAVAEAGPARYRPHWKGSDTLRTARTCYDHLAGRIAVAITDVLIERDHIELGEDGGVVTASGVDFLTAFGIDLEVARRCRRAFCRPCLDWSERRPHLAGAVGAGLAERAFALGWFERMRDSRAVAITKVGERGLLDVFGVSFD